MVEKFTILKSRDEDTKEKRGFSYADNKLK